MQVPVFRAKDKDSGDIVEGFYFEYPVTNGQGPIGSSDPNLPVLRLNTAHCLITYKPGMMGLVNEPVGCTVDMTTLQFVRFVEVPCNLN